MSDCQVPVPALQFVDGKDFDARGVVCSFFNVDEQTGIKMYYNAKVGHNEYLKSLVAYRLGLGPKVWGFDKRRGDQNSKGRAAFYVQRVTIVSEIYQRLDIDTKYALEDWCFQVERNLSEDFNAKLSEFNQDSDIYDLHPGNIGLIDGQPYMVDFSHCRIGNLPHCNQYRYE